MTRQHAAPPPVVPPKVWESARAIRWLEVRDGARPNVQLYFGDQDNGFQHRRPNNYRSPQGDVLRVQMSGVQERRDFQVDASMIVIGIRQKNGLPQIHIHVKFLPDVHIKRGELTFTLLEMFNHTPQGDTRSLRDILRETIIDMVMRERPPLHLGAQIILSGAQLAEGISYEGYFSANAQWQQVERILNAERLRWAKEHATRHSWRSFKAAIRLPVRELFPNPYETVTPSTFTDPWDQPSKDSLRFGLLGSDAAPGTTVLRTLLRRLRAEDRVLQKALGDLGFATSHVTSRTMLGGKLMGKADVVAAQRRGDHTHHQADISTGTLPSPAGLELINDAAQRLEELGGGGATIHESDPTAPPMARRPMREKALETFPAPQKKPTDDKK